MKQWDEEYIKWMGNYRNSTVNEADNQISNPEDKQVENIMTENFPNLVMAIRYTTPRSRQSSSRWIQTGPQQDTS